MSRPTAEAVDGGAVPSPGTGSRRAEGLLVAGVALMVVAALGWVVTFVVTSFTQQPDTTEDLTAEWEAAGRTPLGDTARVEVPSGRTLVAFIVGTQLLGSGGTTGGDCSATSSAGTLGLGWPVLIQQSVSGVLVGDQQTVAIAGWTNDTGRPATVAITCDSSDSTVEHFVAVPTRTGAVRSGPWFQPWAWIGLGAVGVALLAVAVVRSTRSGGPDPAA